MSRPIANARHVPPRPRRDGPSPAFRAVLLLALVLIAGLAIVGGRLVLLGGAHGSAPVAAQVPVDGIATGACMSYAPGGRSARATVFVDAGHGGLDPGVVGALAGGQVLEKDVTLAVTTRLATMLTADGYRVVVSRVGDSSVTRLAAADTVSGALTADAVHRDLLARAACANASRASVLLSVHFNAFDDPSIGGTETFYDPDRQFASESKALATSLQSALVAALRTTDRGVWTDDQLVAPALTPAGSVYGHFIELGPAAPGWVDRPSQMPGALVEPLFLSNPAEAAYAASASGQERVASALRAGLETYLTNA
jgi:N-acetylmuramoyl-L-alanine amidase